MKADELFNTLYQFFYPTDKDKKELAQKLDKIYWERETEKEIQRIKEDKDIFDAINNKKENKKCLTRSS